MGGTIAGVTAAGVGTGVGLYYLNEYQKKAQCDRSQDRNGQAEVNSVVNASNSVDTMWFERQLPGTPRLNAAQQRALIRADDGW